MHEILTNTDFYEDHHHEVGVRTGFPIDVGDGRDMHFSTGPTTVAEGHFGVGIGGGEAVLILWI